MDFATSWIVADHLMIVAIRKLQTLFTPKTLNLFVVYVQAISLQKLYDLAVAIAAVLLHEPSGF
jgi:hypothetical protein